MAQEAEIEADHLPEVDVILLPHEVALPLEAEVSTDGLLPERKEWIMEIDGTISVWIVKEIISEIEETNFEVMTVEWITETIEMIGGKRETIFEVLMIGKEDEILDLIGMAAVEVIIEIVTLVAVMIIIEEMGTTIDEVGLTIDEVAVEDMAKPIGLDSPY